METFHDFYLDDRERHHFGFVQPERPDLRRNVQFPGSSQLQRYAGILFYGCQLHYHHCYFLRYADRFVGNSCYVHQRYTGLGIPERRNFLQPSVENLSGDHLEYGK